jgi:hypothetical protein
MELQTTQQAVALANILKDDTKEIAPEKRKAAMAALGQYRKANPGALEQAFGIAVEQDPSKIERKQERQAFVPETENPDNFFVQMGQEGKSILPSRFGGESMDAGELANTALHTAVGVADLAAVMATGAFAQVASGFGGLLYGASTAWKGGDFGQSAAVAAERQQAWADALTFMPKSDLGKLTLAAIAEPMEDIDVWAMDIGEWVGMGNPMVSTAVYTAINGLAEVVPASKLGKALPKARIRQQRREMREQAKSMGIVPKQKTLSASVVKVANDMGSDERAQNAPMLAKALRDARQKSREDAVAAGQQAKKLDDTVNAKDVESMGRELENFLLNEKMDLANMPAVSAAIDSLKNFNKTSPLRGDRKKQGVDVEGAEASGLILPDNMKRKVAAENNELPGHHVELDEIWTIRNRLEKGRPNPNKTRGMPDTLNENIAANGVVMHIDRMLDKHFIDDMVEGTTPEALNAWRKQDKWRKQHNKRFRDDQILRKIMEPDVTPTTIRKLVMGVSDLGSKTEAGTIIKKIKNILGDDHPAVKGIQSDYLFEITAPLTKSLTDGQQPNFQKFITKWEDALHKNKPLVDALDIDIAKMNALKDWAIVAKKVHHTTNPIGIQAIATALARLWAGHSIAKQGMKVSILGGVLGKLMGRDLVSSKKIINEAIGAQHGSKAMDHDPKRLARFARDALITDVTDTNEYVKESDWRMQEWAERNREYPPQ